MSLSFTATASLAFCSVGGSFIGRSDTGHLRVEGASIEFGANFAWYFNEVNVAPQIQVFTEPTVSEGGTQVLTITATDANATDTLSFSITGLPAFSSFVDNNDGSATLTLSPLVGDAASYNLSVMVTDSGVPSLQASVPFNLTVTPLVLLDTDNDGLTDYDEVNVYLTLPDNPDTDGDFISDGDEVNNGSDPKDDTSWPNYADGDIAPLGAPDGLINAGDYLIAQRISLGELSATSLELSHGDLFPPGSPDGVIDTSDLILLLKLIQ